MYLLFQSYLKIIEEIYIDLIIGEFIMFFNPTTLLQLVSLFLVITAGPAIIVLIALRRGNL
jgi:hypothetical protein